MQTAHPIIAGLRKSFLDQKNLAEQAFHQVNNQGLNWIPTDSGNSIAILVKHLSGHLSSRFKDFFTSDGERADRNKAAELSAEPVTAGDLKNLWDNAWEIVLSALDELEDSDMVRTKNLRGAPLTVAEYLPRVLVHTAYHTGQIILLAKQYLGDRWKHLE